MINTKQNISYLMLHIYSKNILSNFRNPNLNLISSNFFLSKHLLMFCITFTSLILLPLSFIFEFAAWCIFKKTLSLIYTFTPQTLFYWNIFLLAATHQIKPRFFHKKCRKTDLNLFLYLFWIMLNHCITRLMGRVCSNPRHLIVFYFGSWNRYL